METGTTSYLDRMALTQRLDENVIPFLSKHNFQITEFGHPVITNGNGRLANILRRQVYKKCPEMLFIKFSPDFIVVPSTSTKGPFFMDTKSSITPVYFGAQIERIRLSAGLDELRREDIFVIEREAWDNYTRVYPPHLVALIVATPYNPRLLLAEWVSNLKALFRFGDDHNILAGGSGTPHININLSSMRSLQDFLYEEFKTKVDAKAYSNVLNYIKLWPLNKPGRVNWTQFNNVVAHLRVTCPWLEHRMLPAKWKSPQI